MATDDSLSTAFIPPLPVGKFVNEPSEIDRFTVQIFANGTISFKGPRARVEEFLNACAETGMELRVDYISLCG